ncbi:dioxygenase [Amycolatopsis ultiminotia]|uniref:dioxygenase family protein n=1 Tax=Amycolatopsis ultiminotia TaxID=543629 RepID=UPI0031EE458C
MIVENAHLRIVPGREADFERAFRAAQPILTGAQGCLSAGLFPDAEDDSAYLLQVTWRTLRDHVVTFPGSEAGRRFAEQVAHFFDGEPQVRHFETSDIAADPATSAVVDSFRDTPDPRLRAILGGLTRHLHAFVREARPSIAEWNQAVEFLTEAGQKCTDTRQEFILLSDVLGVSMLVETMNAQQTGTASTVLGPFHLTESPRRALGDSIDLLGKARPCVISGRVLGADGEPVPGADIDVWQCTEDGFYDVQQPGVQPPGNGRGRFTADGDGRYWFRTVVPSHYPIPTDGPVGRLLESSKRHPYRPAHVHFIVGAAGYRELTTHAFVADSPYLESDAVFAVKPSLVVDFAESPDEAEAAGYHVTAPFVHAQFDIILEKHS